MVWGALVGATQQVPAVVAAAGLTDSFNRADSAVSLGNADTGQAWTAHAGTWGIASNRAYSASDTHADLATADAGIADGTWQIIVNGDIADLVDYRIPYLVFHGLDASNFLVAALYDGSVNLYKVAAGVFTALAVVATTTSDATDYTLTVITSGNAITVKVDAVTKINHTLAGGDTVYAAYTRVGMRMAKDGAPAAAARWDTLSVQV